MVNRTLSNEERQHIISLYLHGHSAAQIARIMGIRRTTVSTVLSVYNKTGRVAPMIRGRIRIKKITDEVRASIRQWIDENFRLTLKELAERVPTYIVSLFRLLRSTGPLELSIFLSNGQV
ncbi:hypothetical protein ENBRE01_1833 [Enteropsectra breve]|nr:hypothetical protein ENBRE01_1833 [Enteropsectra breve]